jgi:hypothetical protein
VCPGSFHLFVKSLDNQVMKNFTNQEECKN